MNDHDTTRERVADAISRTCVEDIAQRYHDASGNPPRIDDLRNDEEDRIASVAIAAHSAELWRRADDPDVAHTVDSICIVHGMSRTESEGLIETVLTALLGPRPVESFSASEVGQAVELYRAVAGEEATDEQ